MKRRAFELALICFVFVGGWISTKLLISTTDSLRQHVFWKTNDVPVAGQYAEFKFNHEFIKAKGVDKTFTKRVACASGQTLTVKNSSYFCDDKYLGYMREKGMSGDDLPAFIFNGKIPEHHGFMLGDNPYSGDSRYFGLIDLRTAKRVIPLW